MPEETLPHLLGPSSAAVPCVPLPGTLSPASDGALRAPLHHTAFDVGAAMGLIFVLFSATASPLTHACFSFLGVFVMHEHKSTPSTFPLAQLCALSGGGDRREGSELH